ncbi:uncharacterized protein DSM5745_03949 [Aspergillus mulundensis]|uniref:Uncharacterized protein n=1 Tax=Aspergillus mulundensis TaxID=1810919 RepID=A0A3D8SBH9_9EURO|nr:hypothetical protein DSM5745_03949 [Aspergillus mulundensis]RDW83623.1 hypothetical protein DSM5745_03949 [Aspergillus mulundensis]
MSVGHLGLGIYSAYQTADGDHSENFSETTCGGASYEEPEIPALSKAMPSQPEVNSVTPRLQDQTEPNGNVYGLTPTDLLEISTALVTQKLTCPGPLLLTEPFFPPAKPFITVPITTQLCLYLRNQRRRVM